MHIIDLQFKIKIPFCHKRRIEQSQQLKGKFRLLFKKTALIQRSPVEFLKCAYCDVRESQVLHHNIVEIGGWRSINVVRE